MFFVMERTRKVMEELMRRMFSDAVEIRSFQMKTGDFRTLQDAEQDPSPWQDYQTGGSWGGRLLPC